MLFICFCVIILFMCLKSAKINHIGIKCSCRHCKSASWIVSMYCSGSHTVFAYGIVFHTTRDCITLNMQVGNTSGELETHVHETWRMIFLQILYWLNITYVYVKFILNEIIYKFSFICSLHNIQNFAMCVLQYTHWEPLMLCVC
jgi:hypothetical protein